LVSLTAVSALCTAACALKTDAWADARLLGDGVLVVVVVCVLVVFAPPEPPPDPLPEPFDEDPEPRAPEELGVVVVCDPVGPIVVTVLVVVFVIVVVVPLEPVFGFLVLPGFDPGSYDANCTVPEFAPVRLVSFVEPVAELDPDPDEPDPPLPPDPPDPQLAVV
jgi:hypothetical protein